ncbi:Translation initiation factor eIF-2B subunit alpha [Nymphon striatum]|nr:Translation initiation factor eIF-2B subunit alpha [Nymphon striatum]
MLMKEDTSIASVKSGCELFMRFVTPLSLDDPDFNKCKQAVLERSSNFINRLKPSRLKIANTSFPFIQDGSKILTHSMSRVVYETFKTAAKANIRFHVFVTDSAPDYKGRKFHKILENDNIPCTLILDNAVGYIMEKIDLVMVGAEAVTENGGIINKVGTVTIAICAAAFHKPFYVLAESFKFLREYPLNQDDVPKNFRFMPSVLNSLTSEELKNEHPHTDHTPANYITLLFTDLGILAPSAVSDELIKLYT